MINDILDLSKIEAGRMELDIGDFDLHETLEQTCAAARFAAEAKGLALELYVSPQDVPRRVRGDDRRMRQILLNLVANAIKFTANGSVTVEASGARGAMAPRTLQRRGRRHRDRDRPRSRWSAFSSRSRRPTSRRRASIGGTGLGLTISASWRR